MPLDPNIPLAVKTRDFSSPLLALNQRREQKKIRATEQARQKQLTDSRLQTEAQNRKLGAQKIEANDQQQKLALTKAIALDTVAMFEVAEVDPRSAGALGVSILDRMVQLDPDADTVMLEQLLKGLPKDPEGFVKFGKEHVIPGIERVNKELFPSAKGASREGKVAQDVESGLLTQQQGQQAISGDPEQTHSNVRTLPSGETVGLNKQSGQIEIIPETSAVTEARGQPGAKISTAQRGAAPFAQRLLDSGNTITELGEQFTGVISRAAGLVPRGAQSEDRQKFDQATRNFVNATLRRESGAAIAESEFESANLQYIPQPGDGEALLQQKQRNREVIAQALALEAGEAFSQLSESLDVPDFVFEPISSNEPEGAEATDAEGHTVVTRNGEWVLK